LSGCGSIEGGGSASGTGTLVASSNALSFGTVTVGQTASATVSLKNESTNPVQISQIGVSGQPFALMGQNNLPVTIAAAGSYSVSVQFQPTAAGAAAGNLTVTSNASSGNPTITLSGTGAAAATGGSPGAMISPAPGTELPGSSDTFTWSAGSGVTEYQLWVGTTGVGSQNLGTYSEGAASGSTVSKNVSGLPTGGTTVYVRLLSLIQGNWESADYTYIAASTGSTPTQATLSSVSCSSAAIIGAGSDSCTVTLSTPAGSGGFTVSLASSNSALTVPATVTVTAGATSAGFSATAAAVTTAQTATVSATAGGLTMTVALQLSVSGPGLTIGSTTVSFGNVGLNTPATQTVTLTSSGTTALTISAETLTGTGFTMSGVTFPVTLNPGQTATLDLQFDPTTSGAATGSVTLTSNAIGAGTATIALSGTGVSATGYEVQLTWDAPTSSTDPVVGYNIYRAVSGSSSYTLLNSSVNDPTSYTDATVQDGTSYTYEVMSVDASGVQSAPSNTYTAAIP
jgi:hypothetical protein